LWEVETLSRLDPHDQVEMMRRSLDAITTAKKAADKAFTWLYALASASDAYTRQKGARPDASSDEEGPDTPDQR
jgi:hypothetical protein